jgi:phosphopantetheinyl transferase
MILRSGSTEVDGGSRSGLEREQLTLSNVQIDSWLATRRHLKGLANGEIGMEAAAMYVLRAVLARYAWRRPETLELVRSASGRWFLRDDVLGRPLYFGCAGSAQLVAVIVSREPRIGLEIVNPSAADGLIPRIEDEICAQERDAVAGLSPAARIRALLAIWTRKRALQQANAAVDLVPLKSIVAGVGELPLELPSSFGWLDGWRLHGFTLRSGEIGSIAVYRHEQLLVLGAGDRRGVRGGRVPAYERRRPGRPP